MLSQLKSPYISVRTFAQLVKCKKKSLAYIFQKHGIIPDVIKHPPKAICSVKFEKGCQADMGNELKPSLVKYAPAVYWKAQNQVYYTLCMVDPDMPNREAPIFREWHNWLVGNIPSGNVNRGQILSAYIGSAPAKQTGLHRYVVLVYQQNGKIKFQEPRLPASTYKGREGFSIRKFAKKYKLGKPVAANFFQARWDGWVPVLYMKLGLEQDGRNANFTHHD